jgi:DHHC palmitoyltransferase
MTDVEQNILLPPPLSNGTISEPTAAVRSNASSGDHPLSEGEEEEVVGTEQQIGNNVASWSDIAANNDTDNDMVRQWKESQFAVGLTHRTWADENIGCCDVLKNFTPFTISACCCRCAGRVGNMIVIRQGTEQYHDPITATTIQRPKLRLVLGPYWMVLVFVTIPIFLLLSFHSVYNLTDSSGILSAVWMIFTLGLFGSLIMVSCSDPGILYRHHVPPTGQEENWQWNDQALTYRPIHAKYDPECAVVIEKFDHTCAWTGTAIGKRNMFWFRIFVMFVIAEILFYAILLTLLQ